LSKAFRSLIVAIGAIGVSLAFSVGASAQLPVGQTAPGVNPPLECDYNQAYDEVQTSVASGTGYVVPAPGGVITSWSTNAGEGAGQALGFKVFRPLTAATYLIVGHDGPRPLTPSTLNTFPVSIPVKAGDIVGVSVLPGASVGGVSTACEFETGALADQIAYHEGLAPDGTIFAPENGFAKSRLNVSATILPPPAISAITPAAGSIKGGTSVVLTGANFALVQGVTFGTTAASAFTVSSEGQITAIAPASKTLSKVPITVTTAAGAVSSVQTFAYEGCQVPQLKGKKLKAAKKTLRKKDCKVGKVKKTGEATAKTGKVKKQNPKPGKILAPGTKVNVSLG
jgi:hypothetical protein